MCVQNQRSGKGRDWHPSSFILLGPSALLTPIRLLYPLGPFPPTLLCSDLRFPEIAGCLGPSSASEIASDAHPQSHRRILALDLRLKTPNDLLTTNLPEYQSRGGRDRRDAAEQGLRAVANEFQLRQQRQGWRRLARASTQCLV